MGRVLVQLPRRDQTALWGKGGKSVYLLGTLGLGQIQYEVGKGRSGPPSWNWGSSGMRRQVHGRALGKQSLFHRTDSGRRPGTLRCVRAWGPAAVSLGPTWHWSPAQTQPRGMCWWPGDTWNQWWFWALNPNLLGIQENRDIYCGLQRRGLYHILW